MTVHPPLYVTVAAFGAASCDYISGEYRNTWSRTLSPEALYTYMAPNG